MEPVIGIAALFVFGGLLTHTITERRHRTRWVRFEQREIEPHEGPFRRDAGPAPTRTVIAQHRAPATIRRTALWSIYMGQMAVPGGMLGLLGLLFAGIGLISIPGMILAIRIWRVGYALLRRDPAAEHEARALYSFAVGLNVIGVCVAGFLVIVCGWELAGVSLVLVVYAGVSYAHAIALRRCAELLAEDRECRARAYVAANRAGTPDIQPAA
jgi:hypothetical protein